MVPNTVLKCFDTEISYYGSKGFCWLGLYNSFTLYSKLFPHKFWLQNLSFGSKWYPWLVCDPKWNFSLDLKHNIVLAFWETKSTYFCSKMLYYSHFYPKKTVWAQKGLYLNQNIVLKCFDTEISYYGLKVSLDLVYTITLLYTQNFFLTSFDFKISHLGPNDYPRLVCHPKWNFSLDLKHNIVLAFWKTKISYFFSKMLYCPHFYPKKTVWTQKGL